MARAHGRKERKILKEAYILQGKKKTSKKEMQPRRTHTDQ